jgi:Coproporphyrinogen III oxidase
MQRWYGGGADLTPYYINDADVTGFHKLYRDICRKHGTDDDYTRFKVTSLHTFLTLADTMKCIAVEFTHTSMCYVSKTCAIIVDTCLSVHPRSAFTHYTYGIYLVSCTVSKQQQ